MRPRSVAQRHLKQCCFLFLLVLPWLTMASAFQLPADFNKRATISWGPHQQIHGNSVHSRPSSSSFSSRILAQNDSAWNTLDGSTPLVIARGGSSGLFPDQTTPAYSFAAVFSLPSSSALMCDLQLTKDGMGICRTGIDLGSSTTVSTKFPHLSAEYSVNGVPKQGYFSIDLTSTQALYNISAIQPNLARSPAYDGVFPISAPEDLASFTNNTSLFVWINVEYANFFSQHKLDISSYMLALLVQMQVNYISSPEIAFLKAIKIGAPKNTPKLVLRFGGKEEVEPSTNVTYGSLLTDLKTIATYASGILVPKEYIWPVDNLTSYLGAESNLIREAHTAGLAIYASNFVNDPASPIYNYSFDPVREYLQYVPFTGSNVDGFLTDFPATASEALACFRTTALARKAGAVPYVISHNGDSGNFPGCTLLSYESAVLGGASHIDCAVQMTNDGVPICRESPNLLTNTDVATHSNLFTRVSTINQLQGKGVYTFNMTWTEIQTLKGLWLLMWFLFPIEILRRCLCKWIFLLVSARMFSPEDKDYHIKRNQAYNQESIITLSEFLNYAKNTSVGILVDIQNGYFLETEIGLNVVGSVIDSLNAAGLNTSDRVVIQSEDSAVLRRFQQLTNYTLVYRVTASDIIVTKTEVAEVKALANYVTLPRGLVQVASYSYLLNKTDIVDQFHAQNISVFVSVLRNEFITLPFDYEADPLLELNTLVQQYQVDGLITDFPATATAYLSNSCLNTQASGLQYSMRVVVPGDLVTTSPLNIPAPPPASTTHLNVSEGEAALPPSLSPRSSPTTPQSSTPAKSPAPSASAAFRWTEPNFFVLLIAALSIIFGHFH